MRLPYFNHARNLQNLENLLLSQTLLEEELTNEQIMVAENIVEDETPELNN